MDRTDELLGRIRALQGLKNAILAKINVYKWEKRVEFIFVTDRSFSGEEEYNEIVELYKFQIKETREKISRLINSKKKGSIS